MPVATAATRPPSIKPRLRGVLVYALRRPNPWPAVFGYHEVYVLPIA